MLRKLLLAASLAAALTLPAAAHAQQDPWEQQVRSLLAQAGKTFEDRGYQLTHQVLTGALSQSATTMLDVRLDAGTTYQIIGVCDNDCSDLDLTLYDADGKQVDADTELDDVPMVAVAPPHPGTYRLQVQMATCSDQPCRFGVGIFGK
jgi:hypothetical protein